MKMMMSALLLACGFAASAALAQDTDTQASLTETDQRIVRAVDANFADQLAFLEKTVNQNSGTLNVVGVRAVGAMYEAPFQALGFDTSWIEMPAEMARAGHFVATRTFDEPGPHLLLIGHLDTVFEPDDDFQTFRREGDRASGPGIADMKGGNTVILYALRALSEADALAGGTITVFLTGDEESVGSPIALARKDLIAAGKRADFALNFEGMSPGYAVIGRRGSSNWSLEVTARQAHSSGIFRDGVGAGAIFEIARILNRFYGEVRGPFGLTFNAGNIAGGTSVTMGETKSDQAVFGKSNVIPNRAVAHGGLRFMTEAQKEAAREAMRKIVEDSLPQSDSTISFQDRYPAMEETPGNKALLARLNIVHKRMGVEPVVGFPPERRGAADISFVAPYVTGMDGLGVDGDGAHAPGESMDIASMRFATRRAALFLADLLAGEADQ